MDTQAKIESIFPNLNQDQLTAITSTEGPVLVVAGPGTGKTLTLVLRTMYILLEGKAQPKEIMITTFTEKAAFELRDRLSQAARQLDYQVQMHDLKVGTVHGLCDKIIEKMLPHTPLKKGYTILDDLTQPFFIYENFDRLFPDSSKINDKFLGRWRTKWEAIKNVTNYFNKITEELIAPEYMKQSRDSFSVRLADAYDRYEKELFESNKVDFGHIEKIFYTLITNEESKGKIDSQIKYLMVDEYQDTNFVQEQIFLSMTKQSKNLCVVGDDDQSMYRFRGATVRNLLEFKKNLSSCKEIKLVTNYRSHKLIIEKYSRFMNSIDWKGLRLSKDIKPDPEGIFPNYPAVFSIWGGNSQDEAARLCDLVEYLKKKQIVQDYSDIAILMNSVKTESSGHYIGALRRRGVPFFAPRAKAYFSNNEVGLLVGSYAILFGFYGEAIDSFSEKEYVNESINLLKDYIGMELADFLKRRTTQIERLASGSLEITILDLLYQLLAYNPFCNFLKSEVSARNISIFSSLLSIFQDYYRISVITAKNKKYIKYFLFGSFLHFLLHGGIDDYEDPDNPIPKGFVQLMTIHQSKGLEFPVIIVDSLHKIYRTSKQVDRDLQSFYKRPPIENEHQITEFDRMRHYYVAFSRAQKMLVLTTNKKPQDYFSPIIDGLDQWPYIKQKALAAQKFSTRKQFIPKKTYSLSGINVYETCPQQYLFYNQLGFQPSRSAQLLFGNLVHYTIENLHKYMLDKKIYVIDQDRIEKWFSDNYRALLASGLRPINIVQQELALKQVFNYYKQNKDFFPKLQETEVDVSVEKNDYILTGKIDLLLGNDGKLEILDFKTQQRPSRDSPTISKYFNQLCLYAHILHERYGKKAERLYVYWTAEENRNKALMQFNHTNADIERIGEHFNRIVKDISYKRFQVLVPPDYVKVCKECDFRHYCSSIGIIKSQKLKTH